MAKKKQDKQLDAREQRFVVEYCASLEAEPSAIKAGYSPSTARTRAYQWVGDPKSKPHVYAAIQAHKRQAEQRAEIKLDSVVQQLGRMLFIDPRKLVDEEGNPLPIHKLPEDAALAIQSMKVVTVGNQHVGRGEVLEYKFASRDGAADKLMKHLGGYEVDNRQRGGEVADLLREIAGSTGVLDQARERSENG